MDIDKRIALIFQNDAQQYNYRDLKKNCFMLMYLILIF